ncbi:MAG: transporter substrate-binding domain-containing protein [Atopobiaceae bacterium]
MKRHFRAFLVTLLVALLSSALAGVPAQAASLEDRTVTVGVYGNSMYAYQDSSGTWYGIDIELLTNIAQRKGLTLKFVDSANDPDFLASLEAGTYDVATEVVKTSDRADRFLFCDTALGNTSSAKLEVLASNDTWEYGNVDQISRMRVGIVSTFAANGTFREWCAARGLTPTIVEYSTVDELSAALGSGEIDGEVVSAISGDANQVQRILELAPVDYYYAFRKDDAQLKNTVDEAMDEILVENPYYLTNLTSKYTTQSQAAQIPFSKSEKDYIASHGPVKVAVVANNHPYYWAESDGTAAGIIPDYYATVAQKTGLAFEYVPYATYGDMVEAVQNGEADLVSLYANGIIPASQDGLALTESYSSTANVLLTLTGTSADSIRTIAVNARSEDVIKSSLKADFGDAELVTLNSAADCLAAVDSGKADAMVVDTTSAQWFVNEAGSSRYSTSPLPWATMEFAGAVKWNDTLLGSILNKGISTTKTSYDSIVTSDTLPTSDFASLVMRIPPVWLATAAAVLLALAVGLVIALVLLGRRQRERAAVQAARLENERKETEIAALARTADEKNRFFSNISHDMRTPLNAVIGFSQLAKDPSVSPEEKDEYFDKIQTSGNLLLNLINDTLTLSRLSNGKLELKPEPVHTERIGADVTTPIREAAKQHGITFVLDKTGYRPRTVMADALNLEKVFLNLLSNAIKYTPSGGHVWVTVRDEPAGAPDPDLVFTIRDDGIGISKEFLPHLFEPFAQEGRISTTAGTGLGLSIVKDLVDQMGGTISVESQVDEGTTFTLRLHLEEVEGTPDDVARASRPPDKASLVGKRVLVCEDNAINAEVACKILERMGVGAEVAENGKVGLDLFEGSEPGRYDAILMDVRMPVMDGLAATRAIRALDRPDARTIPIVALTADAFADDIEKDRAAGMSAHLSKPVDPDRMAAVLAELI